MRFSSKKEKKKTNDNNNKDINDDVNDRAVNEENVPLLLKPIMKNKNRAHTWTFFCDFISRRPVGGVESSRAPLALIASV